MSLYSDIYIIDIINSMSVSRFPVLILSWARPRNMIDHILPALLQEECVSKIIIAHGNPKTIFGVPEGLADGEVLRQENIWHIGNYASNEKLKCFRRWELIRQLKRDGLLEEECILVQDDDIVFGPGEIVKIAQAYHEGKGVLVTGSGGRNIVGGKYNMASIYGKCDIALGQSIFTKVDTICRAVDTIYERGIPADLYTYEDDITMSYFTLPGGKLQDRQHYGLKLAMRGLSQNHAVCARKNHLQQRNRTLGYLLRL